MINAKVVRNADDPVYKFSFIIILALCEAVNYFDECVLENVFSKKFVFYQQVNGSKNFVFVLVDEYFERSLISTKILFEQLLFGLMIHKKDFGIWIFGSVKVYIVL